MGMLLWKGSSLYEPEVEIGLVVTGYDRPSANRKTGALLQTWIMCTDEPPHTRVFRGDDSPVCGPCPLRALRGCFVQTAQAPYAVWEQQERLGWVVQSEVKIRSVFSRFYERNPNAGLRRGTYGDPAAVPADVWDLVQPSSYRPRRRKADGTGYSHGWRSRPDLARTLMASVHTPEEAALAQNQGWRTFRTMPVGGEVLPGEVLCPASKRAGYRSTCETCRLCDGSKGPDDLRANVSIEVHGFVASRAARASENNQEER